VQKLYFCTAAQPGSGMRKYSFRTRPKYSDLLKVAEKTINLKLLQKKGFIPHLANIPKRDKFNGMRSICQDSWETGKGFAVSLK